MNYPDLHFSLLSSSYSSVLKSDKKKWPESDQGSFYYGALEWIEPASTFPGAKCSANWTVMWPVINFQLLLDLMPNGLCPCQRCNLPHLISLFEASTTYRLSSLDIDIQTVRLPRNREKKIKLVKWQHRSFFAKPRYGCRLHRLQHAQMWKIPERFITVNTRGAY